MEYRTINDSDARLNSIIDTLTSFAIALIMYVSARQVEQIEAHKDKVLIYAGIILLSYFLYYFITEYRYQKTLGNFLTQTKVVKTNNGLPNEIDIFLRTISRFFPLAFIVNFFVDSKFHETISNTKVVYDK